MPTPFHRLTAKEKLAMFWKTDPPGFDLQEVIAVNVFADWCDAEDAKSIREVGAMDREVTKSLFSRP